MTLVHGRWRALLAALALCACSSSETEGVEASGVLRQGVVYGRDDRVELLDYPDTTLVEAVTEQVGALLPRSALSRDGVGWRVSGPTLQSQLPLCEGERFTEQLRVATCTAMLIRPDVIMTAGHCVTAEFVSEYVFVRGYYLGDTFPLISADRVVEFDTVLAKIEGDLTSLMTPDLAIVQLQSPQPLPAFDLSLRYGALALSEPVVVVGASEGLPLKIDAGAAVFAADASGYFEITSDTFRGNSGSPVLASDGHLLGMFVGGAPDYEWSESSQCYRRLVFDAPVARGELVVGVTMLQTELDRALAEAERETPAHCSAVALGTSGKESYLLFATGVWLILRLRRINGVNRTKSREATRTDLRPPSQ